MKFNKQELQIIADGLKLIIETTNFCKGFGKKSDWLIQAEQLEEKIRKELK